MEYRKFAVSAADEAFAYGRRVCERVPKRVRIDQLVSARSVQNRRAVCSTMLLGSKWSGSDRSVSVWVICHVPFSNAHCCSLVVSSHLRFRRQFLVFFSAWPCTWPRLFRSERDHCGAKRTDSCARTEKNIGSLGPILTRLGIRSLVEI